MDNFIRPSSNCFVAAKAAKIKVAKRDETRKKKVVDRIQHTLHGECG